jgi:oligopeptide/dipeptide ABC transporter ATP-binding protein
MTAHNKTAEVPVADGSAGGEPLVELSDVCVTYQVNKSFLSREKIIIKAVDHVSLTVKQGETLGLVGSTGSGKSTLAHLIMGMVQPSSGSVKIAGHELKGMRGDDRREVERLRQVVLQDPYSSLNPRMRIRDIISEPLTLGRPTVRHRDKAKIEARVSELLELVGLPTGKAGNFPYQFSGGQRQRISIARALSPDPKLIVLDEPTSALDVSVRAQVLNLLRKLQQDLGVTYMIVSHDLLTVAYLASTVAVMDSGRIVEVGPTESLYHSPRHPRTLELLASVPGTVGSSLLTQPRPISETVEVLPETACQFADRCALRTHLNYPARCTEESPQLQTVGARHQAACHFPDELEGLKNEVGPDDAPQILDNPKT